MPITTEPRPIAPGTISGLRARATEAAAQSYSPYSKFKVGAAVLLEDGSVFTGCNVENASYRLTICAEHSAIAAAVSTSGPKIRVKAISVANLNESSSMPCGACRQILLEFGSPNTWIYGPSDDGPVNVLLKELLPYGFHLAAE